jgi:isoaspartyl peptidase/L-asparaginase-like protein (Ntn-hydrolase superfamily)
LRRIKSAISVARKVMEKTQHTILAGDLATAFAVTMGFKEESLSTPQSEEMHESWKNNSCQPNFWKDVKPDPSKNCGPYMSSAERKNLERQRATMKVDRFNHDTISMVALDSKGRIASGTSSNGARNKIPGRVGDAPIVGAGSYVDREVGGAACTGDGDVMMRFLPSLIAVEEMRRGSSPTKAAEVAIGRIIRDYPNFSGGIVALNIEGQHGAACHNLNGGFPYTVRSTETGQVAVLKVDCI